MPHLMGEMRWADQPSNANSKLATGLKLNGIAMAGFLARSKWNGNTQILVRKFSVFMSKWTTAFPALALVFIQIAFDWRSYERRVLLPQLRPRPARPRNRRASRVRALRAFRPGGDHIRVFPYMWCLWRRCRGLHSLRALRRCTGGQRIGLLHGLHRDG